MPLKIGTTAFSQWHVLKPLLEQLGWTAPGGNADDALAGVIPDTAAQSGAYILLHTRPEHAIASALDAGIAPDQALAEWQKSASELLKVYKSQRNYAVMVDVLGAAEHPNTLVDWLKQNHSAFFDVASGITEAPAPAEAITAPSELNLLLATQLVTQSDELQRLLPQLEACSVPLTDNHYSPPTVDVLSLHGQLNEQLDQGQSTVERLQNRLEEHEKRLLEAQQQRTSTEYALKNENELLLNQLHKVQEELENYYHKHQSGAKTNDELVSTHQALEAEKQRLADELSQVQKAGQNDSQALEADSKRLKEELDQAQQAKATLESRNQRLETENQHLADDLKAAKDARAQSDANQNDLKEENELVLNQLFQVQEELEKRYLNNKAHDSQLAELQKSNAEITQTKQQAEQKNEQQQKLLIRAEQALEQTEARLASYQKELATVKRAKELAEEQLASSEQLRSSVSKELDEAQQERETAKTNYQQTLPKLFQTQEELEQAVARIEELVNELDHLTEKVEYLNDQVDSKNEKLRKFSDERRQLKARLKLAQDALDHEHADRGRSALAKMAKPLRKLRRSHRLVDQQVHLIEGSELFDRSWYAEQNPDVAAKFTNLAEHYVRHGGQEGRDPSPEFSSNCYLENNPDVVESGLNPLVHYLLHGKAEGRKI